MLAKTIASALACAGLLCALGNAQQPAVVLEAHFDSDTDGFVYEDDAFLGTSQPNYADGARLTPGVLQPGDRQGSGGELRGLYRQQRRLRRDRQAVIVGRGPGLPGRFTSWWIAATPGTGGLPFPGLVVASRVPGSTGSPLVAKAQGSP